MESQQIPVTSYSDGCELSHEGGLVSETSTAGLQSSTSRTEAPQSSSFSLGSPTHLSDADRQCSSRQQAAPDVSSVLLGDRSAATNPRNKRRPPFYLIPTTPEKADAILVIPSSESPTPRKGTPQFTETSLPSQIPHGHSPRVAPLTPHCPLMPLTTGVLLHGTGNSIEESVRSSGKPERTSVLSQHLFEEQERHRGRGLLFVGTAMGHVHAMQRARRIPQGTRVTRVSGRLEYATGNLLCVLWRKFFVISYSD